MPNSIQPDWVSMQYDSFHRFFSKQNPPPELSLESIFQGKIKWTLMPPSMSAEECLKTGQTYACKLCLNAPIIKPNKNVVTTIDIPAPTEDGEFILASDHGLSNRHVMVMEVNRSIGVHCKEKTANNTTTKTFIIEPYIGKRSVQTTTVKKSVFLTTYGKNQIANLLNISSNNDSYLSSSEADSVLTYCNKINLPKTNERSWKALRVNLIGDFLFKIFYDFMNLSQKSKT